MRPEVRSGSTGTGEGMSQQMRESVAMDLKKLPNDPLPPDFWQEQAACYGVDPDVFFPPSEEEATLALTYCASCSIREMCLSWALKNRERYGVWGGTTEQQRRRLQRHIA
jgi:WhiB family transcriptional regulator, redox-sensing transcriptional regulator